MKIILDSCPAGLALIFKTQHWRDGATPGGYSGHLQLQSRFTPQIGLSKMKGPSERNMSPVVVMN